MKRSAIFLISICLIGVKSANGQNTNSESDRNLGGLRVGYHNANILLDGSNASSGLEGFYVGYFRNTKIIPRLDFGYGLEYFQNGITYSNDSERVCNTLSIPLDLKVNVGPVFALGGLASNFVVSEKVITDDENITPQDSDKTNWFDLAVFLGGGVKFSFVTIEARYHWGLLEARQGYFNRYFQVGIGISF